jgi:5-methylcytosine-specific restriction enzyme A
MGALMALKMLRPRLATINTNKVKVLDTKAGATPRVRGSVWMATRRAVLLRDGYRCCECGRVHTSNEIDHEIPLEQGGSAMDQSNLKVLCVECHKAKSSREAKARFGC